MERKFWSIHRLTGYLAILILLVSFGVSHAQLEGLEFEMEKDTVKCEPDSFITPYDKFKSDSVEQQQIHIWYSLAREEYKYKNYERAIPYYWKVLVNDTTNDFKVVYSKLANSYYNLNEPDSVLLVVYRGLERYPDYTILHYWGGLVQDALGHARCAIPHYEALTKANPNEKSYWSKLAYLYYKEEDPKAIEAQQRVVDLDPKDVEASRLWAEIMEHFGEDPLQARKQTYMNDKSNIENAMKYGKAAFERGLYQDAIQPFKSILEQEPQNTTALEYLGRCYEGLNKLSEALSYYKKILQFEPKNSKIMSLIASVYGRLNDFTTARSYILKAEKVDPGNGLPHMIMAEIYENAVQHCSEQREKNNFSYDDKLVYWMAQNELRQAAKDPNYETDAKRRINQLQNLIPSKSDWFMQKDRRTTREPCYDWIK